MNILLTGDDGYNSIGTRLLIHALRTEHMLTIAGVLHQQSGVGGQLSLRKGGRWGETSIDGVQAFWVDGTPADAMEFIHAKYPQPFDWILSGVNLGENVTSAIISSGTVGAAIRGLTLGVAPRAMSLSWETPPEYYFLKHDENEELSPYLEHPGENVKSVLDYCLEKNNFGTELLNINIPKNKAANVRITQMFTDASRLYPPIKVREDGFFAFPPEVGEAKGVSRTTDLGALKSGEISISPLTIDWTNSLILETIQPKEFSL